MALVKIEKDYDEIYNQYSNDYESNVCKERQLPDYLDGMRIVQRRLFWTFLSMSREKRFHWSKSASIVGDAIKLHPHADKGLYESLVGEANSPANLINKKGNWGNRTSSIPSKAAAMRYTECALQKHADNYFKYASMSDMVTGETGLDEPTYIPVPFPYSLISGFIGISKAGLCMIPSYKISDLYLRLNGLLGNVPLKTIKPYYGAKLKIEGDFEKILTTGKGQVTIYPNLSIDPKSKLIIIKEVSSTITNLGSILESMSVDKTYGRYLNIKDLSAKKKNHIKITYNTKYMKEVKISFDQLCKFVKRKLTAKVTYNVIAYKGYKDYPTVSIDTWLLENFNRLLDYRKRELEDEIVRLQDKLKLFNAILIIRPTIQVYLNKYNKFTKTIIERMKKDMLKLINNDTHLLGRLMQMPIMRLMDIDVDIKCIEKEIKDVAKLNTPEQCKSNILTWISTIEN